ncbi:DUF4402 domain-containing protein [Gillisia sp. M10.2A]|uniref:DUF4402 domain-containing protein n=1 Tax=Gillisia lutea TaxID=2909668 RepID=A0ABS9EJ85_9FLAO|nr:DUF4402 domain-containing protein [Gillisia lutea]MCF4101538.1 DUF4402 domain-containing protein [Gillisia lutea]
MAQATANFTASATIIQPIGITTTSNMSFANLDAKSGGAVILSPDNTRLTSGDVALADGTPASAASFTVTGETGFTYAVTLPSSEYVLTNGSENMIIKDFTSNIDNSGSLAGGSQNIRVGATLKVNPNQTPGNYTSPAGFNVTVNYN